jgi:hypothetical protein
MNGKKSVKNLEEIDKMFVEYQRDVLIKNLQKYKEENIELKAIIIKLASRIVELERNNRYID